MKKLIREWGARCIRHIIPISIGLIGLVSAILVFSSLREEVAAPRSAASGFRKTPEATSIVLPVKVASTEVAPASVSILLEGIMYSAVPGASSALVQVNGSAAFTVWSGDFVASGVAVLDIGKDYLVYGNDKLHEVVHLRKAGDVALPVAPEVNMAPGFRPIDKTIATSSPTDVPLQNGNKVFLEAIQARFSSPTQ